MTTGTFIVVEGIDGVGKGTIFTAIDTFLRIFCGDDNVVTTKEPGGTIVGEGIREVLFSLHPNGGTKAMAPGVADLLFLASHIQNYKKKVKPALDAGKIVLSDRWWYSQFAYMQEREVPTAIVTAYQELKGPAPDILVFMYGDPSLLLDRALSRSTETHQTSKDWSDAKKLSNIQNNYQKMLAEGHFPQNTIPVCVDGKSIIDVRTEVLFKLYEMLFRM